jgi:hypothetical protein
VDGGFDAGVASDVDGGIDPEADAGSDADAGVDPVCLRQGEQMSFYMEVAVIAQDVTVEGAVLSVDGDALTLDVGDGGTRTIQWKLSTMAQPPLKVGAQVRLLYRPYSLGTLQAASILVRDAQGGLLFIADTGLHQAHFSPEEIEVVSIGVAERGCRVFPVRCFEPRNLDLIATDEGGGVQRVEIGTRAAFSYRGVPYEVLNVNMAELPLLECDAIPARYRSYIVQRASSSE